MDHKKRAPQRRQHKIMILGDSHARGCAAELNHLLKNDFEVFGFVDPVPELKHIKDSYMVKLQQLSKEDVVVLWVGSIDISKNNSSVGMKHLLELVMKANHTNLILISVPHRYDLMSDSCVNRKTERFNRKLRSSLEKLVKVEMIEVVNDRNLCTRHGQHLNSKGCIAQRYVVAIMSFLAITNAYTMRVCLSTAITEMVVHHDTNESKTDPDACPSSSVSNNNTAEHGTFDWDEETQGLILSSFFWGYVITHIPGGILAERFGGKYALGLGILSTAIFTLLTPLAATYGGAGWLIAVRFLEGLGEGSTFPALNAILAQWVPPQQRGTLGSFVFAGAQIGTVVGTAVSGVLLHYSSVGWPGVFYVFGSLGVLWFIVWIPLFYNDPQSHPFISDEERMFLEKNIGGINNKKDIPPIPWREICKSVPLWGLVFAQVGHDWGFFTLVTDLPKYFKDVMRFNIFENGFLTALPYLAMWLCSMGSGWMCDYLITQGCLSTTAARKIFTTIASVGPGVGIIAASYAGCDRTGVVVLITVGTALMGTFYPGMKVNALDLSPNYAGTLMAIVNGMGAFTGIVTPYLVGVLTPDSTILQWRTVFWIVLGVFLVTNLLFILMGSGEIQPWNNPLTKKQGGEEACKSEHNPSTDAEKSPPEDK